MKNLKNSFEKGSISFNEEILCNYKQQNIDIVQFFKFVVESKQS